MPKIKNRLFRSRRHATRTPIVCVVNHSENPESSHAAFAIHLRDCPPPDPAFLGQYLILRRVCRPKGLVMQSAIYISSSDPQEPVCPHGIPVPLEMQEELEIRVGRSCTAFLNAPASQHARDFGRAIRSVILPECAPGIPDTDQDYPTSGCTSMAFDHDRLVSYSLFQRSPCNALKLSVGPHGIDRSSADPIPFRSTQAVPYLSVAWTAEHYRGSGLAASAIDEVRRVFSFQDSLAFGLPFTSAGVALTRRASSGSFVGVYPETLSVAVGLRDERVLRDCDARVEVEPDDWDEGLEMGVSGVFANPQVFSL
jgi:hypothetical protein